MRQGGKEIMAKIIEVIETYERRGRGTEEDVIRTVYQLWSKDGKLIYEEPDIWAKSQFNEQEKKK